MMYTEEYERRGFPIRNFLLKLLLVIIFVILLAWLLPKFIVPAINKANGKNNNAEACKSAICDSTGISALTSQIFQDNINKMKDAAITYYTKERLPQEVGSSYTMTLSDMIGKKIILPLVDKNNKPCDVEKSYVKITKQNDEYLLKVNLKDSETEDYILVHLGCYNYCESYICQKQGSEVVKDSKVVGGYVPVKGEVHEGIYYIPEKTTPVVIRHYCVYYDGNFYDSYGNVVNKATYIKSCTTPVEEKHYCVYYDGKFYDKAGNVVAESVYKKSCGIEDKHYCVYYDGKYYDKNGNSVTLEDYNKSCGTEDKHYCVYYKGKYYDRDGNIVAESTYKKSCGIEDKHYCVYYNGVYYDKYGNSVTQEDYKKSCGIEEKHYCVYYNGKYYDKNGNVVAESVYKKSCGIEEKHYCVYYDGKYYDKNGNAVTAEDYKKSCGIEDKHYCVYYNGKFYDDKGNVVAESVYKKSCGILDDSDYLYEYQIYSNAKLSEWTKWSDWNKADCATAEINCSDNDITCLRKLQLLKRKEEIGTYDKIYERKREMLVQTGSYTRKTCSKYNYVIINKTIYATTKTTTYTQINKITTTTRVSTGGWTYNGRASYSNPPSDSAGNQYIFAGADYSYCGATCTTLPNYYYDSYSYSGGDIVSVSTTVTPGPITSTTTEETTSTTTTTTEASCGEIVTAEVPIYQTVIVTEKAKRQEPLYGTVCYSSTKTRELISAGTVKKTWSTHNDTTLLNAGWTYTGNRKLK